MGRGDERDTDYKIRFYCLDPDHREVALSRLWSKDASIDDYCHYLEGSISDHPDTFGLIGVASLFCVPVMIHTQFNLLTNDSDKVQFLEGDLDDMEKKAKCLHV